MRVWMISAASALTAVVLALLIGWEFLDATWTTVLFASISLYAIFVPMLSAAVFVADLRRVCRRLAKPPQTQFEWGCRVCQDRGHQASASYLRFHRTRGSRSPRSSFGAESR